MTAYDLFGFVSDTPISGRESETAPPASAEWPTGKRPNWTGYAWIYLDFPPVLPAALPPAPVSDLQIRLALTQMGLRAAVETAVAAGSQDLKDWWDRSTVLHRDNPLVAEMITAIDATAAQADALWGLAGEL